VGSAALLLPPSLAGTVLRVLPPTENATVLLASFIPWSVVGYLLALVLLGVALLRAQRRRFLAIVCGLCALLLSAHLVWLAPLFVADDRPATTSGFTLISLNMLDGHADPTEVIEQASTADVVVLLEATPNSLWGLKLQGWDDRFPYAVGDPSDSASGSAIYSRFPLTDTVSLPPTTFQQWATTAQVPEIGPVRIMAVHPCNPFCGGSKWLDEHDIVGSAVAASSRLPLVVAGDFNAVDDHGPLRALRAQGLESATDIVGGGWLPTYPANRSVPPLIAIDHILLSRSLTATALSRFQVDGTDHLGLRVTVAGAHRSSSGSR